jgi:hypothetical protein
MRIDASDAGARLAFELLVRDYEHARVRGRWAMRDAIRGNREAIREITWAPARRSIPSYAVPAGPHSQDLRWQ